MLSTGMPVALWTLVQAEPVECFCNTAPRPGPHGRLARSPHGHVRLAELGLVTQLAVFDLDGRCGPGRACEA
ncbi:hypothetical protein ACIG47_19035 [Promicromonospora sp. NPDC052451]|uniref:hypothetical protein n=1 Tax=Promicromonospora sp. NPDC052451 TaxID=3364407 RepID=UPI0037C65750